MHTVDLEIAQSEVELAQNPNLSSLSGIRSEVLHANSNSDDPVRPGVGSGQITDLYAEFGNIPTIDGVERYLSYTNTLFPDNVSVGGTDEKVVVEKISGGDNITLENSGEWINELVDFLE